MIKTILIALMTGCLAMGTESSIASGCSEDKKKQVIPRGQKAQTEESRPIVLPGTVMGGTKSIQSREVSAKP